MNKTILERILDAQREFRKHHRSDPVAVHLTLEDELKLSRLGWNELGTTLESVLRNGVRKTFPTLFGMKAIFDSAQFGIE